MNQLYSAVQFFQVLLLILGGAFFLILPSAPTLRSAIADMFLFKDALFFALGLLLLSVGLVLGIGFYFLQKHRTLEITMGTTIDCDVVAGVVQTYLQNRFPGKTMKTEARIDRSGSLELITEHPQVEMKKHLAEMERELSALLLSTLNYNKKFTLTLLN